MAGTGHPYEVVNRAEVETCLEALAASVFYPEGRSWLRSKHIVKIVTAPEYVIRMVADRDDEAIRKHVSDEAEVSILMEKLAAGGDLRMFSLEMFRQVGPDLGHIVDWLNGLPTGNARMIAKLPRITYTAAQKHAEKWVSAMAKEASKLKGSEATKIVMESSPGKLWMELLDRSALVLESANMNHCVADYSERLGHGTRIFSLRDHHGKSMVTVEIREFVPGQVSVGQIKGNSNLAPPQTCRRDIVALLNAFDVKSELHRDAERIAITRTKTGWTTIMEVAERHDMFGFVGYRHGNSVFILSPGDLENIIVRVNGAMGWWSRSGDDVTVVAVGEVNKHSLPEQRVLATFANCDKYAVTMLGCDYLVRKDGRWMPWIDSCEKWKIGAVEFLHKDDVAYLMSSSGNRIVARIEKCSHGSGWQRGHIVKVENDFQATSSESRRLAALMSLLQVETMDTDAVRKHRGIRRRYNSMEWYYVPDHAVERMTSIKKCAESKMKWVITPWHAALCSNYGTDECVIEISGRVVEYVRLPFRPLMPLMQEICKTMNTMRLVARKDKFVFVEPNDEDRLNPKSTSDRAPYGIIFANGRWRRISSCDSFLEISGQLGGAQFSNEACNETALRLLLKDAGEKHEEARAAHLAAWARRVPSSELRWQSPSLLFGHHRLNPPHKRLIAASGLLHRMTPKDETAVVKAAHRFVKNITGRTSRPKMAALNGADRAVRDIVLAYRHRFDAKSLSRYASWVLAGYGSLIDANEGGVRFDPRWIEVRSSANDGRVSYLMRRELAGAFWGIRHGDKKISIDTGEEADAWLLAVEMSERDSIYGEAVSDGLDRIRFALSAKTGAEWDPLKARAEVLRGTIPFVNDPETMAA